ncbi:hypothetical protein AMTR_s00101p00110720 [Amborella trichopoda]|uniref:Uncharacterized protein n=1 Tax=Amborella trichopoda TaxID=13333 RepID=W1NU30_AMBTC|nr:hypothetical protein AMTR_s00101p00110720 [Amborella trichopoda]
MEKEWGYNQRMGSSGERCDALFGSCHVLVGPSLLITIHPSNQMTLMFKTVVPLQYDRHVILKEVVTCTTVHGVWYAT